MSLKYSNTTADYLQWSEAMNLIRKLAKDGNYKISLLIAIGCFTGLRISDILALRWKQILDVSEFTITERKTGKQRTIRLNKELQEHIKDCYEHIQPLGIAAPILVSQKGTVFTVQRINVILKELKHKYRLKIKHFSCHSLRKTFGRQVYKHEQRQCRTGTGQANGAFQPFVCSYYQTISWITTGGNLGNLRLSYILINDIFQRIILLYTPY